MKKKILFMLINMNVGGTEKALLNMISEIPEVDYDITILMLEEYGGFLNEVPKHVNVEILSDYGKIKDYLIQPIHRSVINFLRKGNLYKAFLFVYFYFVSKINRNSISLYKYVLKKVNFPSNEYEIAVAYAGPMDFISFFIVNKVKAKKKVQWIHFDVKKYGFNKNFALKIYKYFDKVFVVSEEGKEILQGVLPSLKGKIEVFYNLISKQNILQQAEKTKGFVDNFKGTRILTVGRLTEQKGQDILPGIIKKLKNEGYNFRWYLIGDGIKRKELEKQILDNDIKNELVLLGTINNPYPYIKECDIYVQPSRFEGYCITLSEARVFNKPIITTDFVGSEQIKNGKTGLIVNFSEQELLTAIKELLKNKDLKREFTLNLENEIVDTVKEIDKLYDLLI
jgi:glycosyltransferase involved in cell wall biosynthesis